MKDKIRGAKVIVKCKCCKIEFSARVADVNRGWGKFCSKSCKAIIQEKRTGQMSDYIHRKKHFENLDPFTHDNYPEFDPHDHDHASWEADRESHRDKEYF